MKFLLVISLLLWGCAKPNYQDPVAAPNNKPTTPDIKPPVCELFLTQKRLCVDFNWKQKPQGEQLGIAELKFYVQETPQTTVDPQLNVAVVLWMPSMSHGSTPVEVTKIKAGEYEASNIYFIMPGEWEIRIQLKQDKDVVEQVVKKISI